MSLSSLFVVTNALRLTRFGKKKTPLNDEKSVVEIQNDGERVATNAKIALENPEEKTINEKEDNKMKKTVTVEGMMCMHCVAHVKKALEKLDGVTGVEVSLENKTAVVTFNGELFDETITAAIVDAGYEVVSIQA